MKQALVVASNTRVLDSITEAIAKVLVMTVTSVMMMVVLVPMMDFGDGIRDDL